MTRYYRYGELDTCEGRWAAIWACMDRGKRYVRARTKEEKYLHHPKACPVRSPKNSTPTLIHSRFFPRLPQGRPRAERQGAGARAGCSGAGKAVLDPDGPQGGGAAVAETVRRQGSTLRGGVEASWDVKTRTRRNRKTTRFKVQFSMRLLASYCAALRHAHKTLFAGRTSRTTSPFTHSAMATDVPTKDESAPHHVTHDYTYVSARATTPFSVFARLRLPLLTPFLLRAGGSPRAPPRATRSRRSPRRSAAPSRARRTP